MRSHVCIRHMRAAINHRSHCLSVVFSCPVVRALRSLPQSRRSVAFLWTLCDPPSRTAYADTNCVGPACHHQSPSGTASSRSRHVYCCQPPPHEAPVAWRRTALNVTWPLPPLRTSSPCSSQPTRRATLWCTRMDASSGHRTEAPSHAAVPALREQQPAHCTLNVDSYARYFRMAVFVTPWCPASRTGNPINSADVKQYVKVIKREQAAGGVHAARAPLFHREVFTALMTELYGQIRLEAVPKRRASLLRDALLLAVLWHTDLCVSDTLRVPPLRQSLRQILSHCDRPWRSLRPHTLLCTANAWCCLLCMTQPTCSA